uniref:Uncharacterized protein n=1 Tax=Setaria italica TaxID=4555 RepID=K3YNR5_SETIT
MVVAGLGFPVRGPRWRAPWPAGLECLAAAVRTAAVADRGWRGEVPQAADDNRQEGPTAGASGFLS